MSSPKYSKKDYETVAEVLHASKKKSEAVRNFEEIFADDNPNFDRSRFEEAVKTGHTKGMRHRLRSVS
jgi:hypothetical protein